MSGAISKTQTATAYDMDRVEKTRLFLAGASADELIQSFALTLKDLQKKFGSWQIAWGDINRYQRISGDIDLKFDDAKPSLPIGYASSTWGMLPAFSSQVYPGTKKRYGYGGNSFICVVEFGDTIRAKTLLAGGESGSPESAHFSDQAELYRKGQFKDVLFYEKNVMKNAVVVYHPGEE